MRRVENKSRVRSRAGCQAICSAIDHVDPGNADARLPIGTQKSNGEESKKEQDQEYLL